MRKMKDLKQKTTKMYCCYNFFCIFIAEIVQ